MWVKTIILLAALYIQNVCSTSNSNFLEALVNPNNIYSRHLALANSAHLPVLDTPKVKAGHFAAVSKVYSHPGYEGEVYDHKECYGHGVRFGSGYDQQSSGYGDFRYHGPATVPHTVEDEYIADTLEVAVAKARLYAAVAKAYGRHRNGNDYGHDLCLCHACCRCHTLSANHNDGQRIYNEAVAKAEYYAALSKDKARQYGDVGRQMSAGGPSVHGSMSKPAIKTVIWKS